MNITEIRVKLISDNEERLRAFCSVTLDGDFVIRDLKVIEGANGPFVAMPSRKLADRCPKCGGKNHLRARYCNDCGAGLEENRAPRDSQGRVKLHADVAHPINAACREQIQTAVVQAYDSEQERARQPGYRPPSIDEDGDIDEPAHGAAAGQGPEPSDDEKSSISEYDELVTELKQNATSRAARPGRDARARSGGRWDSRKETKEPAARKAPPAAESTESTAEPPQTVPEDDGGFGEGIV